MSFFYHRGMESKRLFRNGFWESGSTFFVRSSITALIGSIDQPLKKYFFKKNTIYKLGIVCMFLFVGCIKQVKNKTLTKNWYLTNNVETGFVIYPDSGQHYYLGDCYLGVTGIYFTDSWIYTDCYNDALGAHNYYQLSKFNDSLFKLEMNSEVALGKRFTAIQNIEFIKPEDILND